MLSTFLHSEPPEPTKSISLSKYPVVLNGRNVPQLLHVVQNDEDVDVTRASKRRSRSQTRLSIPKGDGTDRELHLERNHDCDCTAVAATTL